MRTTPAQARAIARGAKTQLCVPVDTRITARPLRPARRHGGRPLNPILGDLLTMHGGHYTLDENGRDKWVTTDVVHATIEAVQRTTLGTLTAEQTHDEGYETVEEFEIAFVERHERAWLAKQVAYLVEQGIPEDEAAETRDSWARVRYAHLWAPREAWVLQIKAMHDLPLLLAEERGEPKGRELGYVHTPSAALVDEPEAIPFDRLNSRWNIKAARRYQEALDDEGRRRQARSLARRVRKLALEGHPLAVEIERLISGKRDAA